MPDCAAYHDYTREPDGLGRPLHASGVKGLLDGALGVREGRAPLEVLDLLSRRIIVDLRPAINECYALGPYSVFDGDARESSRLGEAVRRAKYENDEGAVISISGELIAFVRRHPRLKSVTTVTAPPRSTRAAPNIPLRWAHSVADAVGASIVETRWRAQPTGARKNREEIIADSMSVESPVHGSVLILDDIIGSGATLCELGQSLRGVGAQRVYGLCVAKDAKFTHGRVDLSKRRWQ